MSKTKHILNLFILVSLVGLALSSCDLPPAKPDEAFTVYRERMKNAQTVNAREMLSEDTRNMLQKIESGFHLDQPAENIAFLNMLDPTVPPTPLTVEEKRAVLELRTLKGTNKSVTLIRSDSKGKWKVDLVNELNILENFLSARKTLDAMQEQAGEFAATWKAMDSHLSRKVVPEADKGDRDQPRGQKKGQPKKKPKAQKSGPSAPED